MEAIRKLKVRRQVKIGIAAICTAPSAKAGVNEVGAPYCFLPAAAWSSLVLALGCFFSSCRYYLGVNARCMIYLQVRLQAREMSGERAPSTTSLPPAYEVCHHSFTQLKSFECLNWSRWRMSMAILLRSPPRMASLMAVDSSEI